ncbi:MAG TPA: EAL domain-containing protein [Halomicronema sp.]
MSPITSHLQRQKLIIQPQDIETSDQLCSLGFKTIPSLPQLVYQEVHRSQLPEIFTEISENLPQISQDNSRFLLTRLPLEDRGMLVEFLQAKPLSTITLSVRNAWFLKLLIQKNLFFKYQPIVDLKSGKIISHECLARTTTEQGQIVSGKELIDAAISTQLTCEFDELARTSCIESIAALKTNDTFFINILPNAIIRNPQSLEHNYQQVLDLGLQPEKIVFELTEVEVLASCPNLPVIIKRLRDWGFGIAVDDLCGCVSIDHYVMEFRPDLVKLDRRLIDGCSQHPLKQTIIKSLLHSAHEEGILVLAEGLESQADINLCRDLGVDYGQGFGLGRPERTLKKEATQLWEFPFSQAS